jgi:flagellar biosynthesis protein FlhB
MKEIRSDIYKIALGGLQVYLFFKLVSLASGFARVYTSSFGDAPSHILVILYGVVFFLIFRNLATMALLLREKSEEEIMNVVTSVARWTLLILVLFLLLQIVPEFILSQRTQLQ